MGQISISITKRSAFRDATQEWANVYTYLHIGVDPSPALSQQFIDEIVKVERPLHSGNILFVKARVWSSGGTKEENKMLHQVPLSGSGAAADNTAVDRERAVLVQWPAGKDKRGRPVKLKKWFHTGGWFGSLQFGGDLLGNLAGFTAAQRTTIEDAVKNLSPLTIGTQQYAMISDTGRFTEGGPRAHRYLEHHQLGDQWRV
jgi:hypothetical protein